MIPSGQRRLSHERRHQHDPFDLVPSHHEHRGCHDDTENWVPCSGYADFPSLLSALSLSSEHSYWIGCQVLYGVGIGCGLQTSNLAAQNVLPRADVPLGLALIFFMQQLGGSVFLSIGQNIFSSKLVDSLSKAAGLDAEAVINTGATDLRSIVPSQDCCGCIHLRADSSLHPNSRPRRLYDSGLPGRGVEESLG